MRTSWLLVEISDTYRLGLYLVIWRRKMFCYIPGDRTCNLEVTDPGTPTTRHAHQLIFRSNFRYLFWRFVLGNLKTKNVTLHSGDRTCNLVVTDPGTPTTRHAHQLTFGRNFRYLYVGFVLGNLEKKNVTLHPWGSNVQPWGYRPWDTHDTPCAPVDFWSKFQILIGWVCTW